MLNICDIKPNSKIYMLGIGGISMSALALMLKTRGKTVKGYDRARSETTDMLQANGIEVFFDFDESSAADCDLIVYSAAFGNSHPVFRSAASLGLPLYSRAELLGAIAAEHRNSVAVAGTHGKSTTSGMLGHIFMKAKGCDPTVVVGAVMREVGSTYRIGTDDNFIFEACEYRDSFLSFFPRIAVVLNISLDHTDYFKDMHQMRDSFVRFMNNTGKDGYAVFNYDCAESRLAASEHIGINVSFSASGSEKADYCARNVKETGGYADYDVYRHGEYYITLKLGAPGEHNVSNSLAAVAVCDICGISKEDIVNGIAGFKGVGRRFEYKGRLNGAAVYDDYAHHPEEIKATLSTAKEIAGKGRVFCVFQPHNYSRLHDLYGDFITAFDKADKLILCPLYAARGSDGGEVSSETLASEIKGAIYMDSYPAITDLLRKEAAPEDVILIVGAGDIADYAAKFGEKS